MGSRGRLLAVTMAALAASGCEGRAYQGSDPGALPPRIRAQPAASPLREEAAASLLGRIAGAGSARLARASAHRAHRSGPVRSRRARGSAPRTPGRGPATRRCLASTRDRSSTRRRFAAFPRSTQAICHSWSIPRSSRAGGWRTRPRIRGCAPTPRPAMRPSRARAREWRFSPPAIRRSAMPAPPTASDARAQTPKAGAGYLRPFPASPRAEREQDR